MDFSTYRAIALHREGRVLHATFNRPEQMNAMDDEMQGDLERLIEAVAVDSETHVLVLTGAGRAFSAGGDIEEMRACLDDPALFRAGTERGKRHIFALLDCPKPVIAKVNGHAIGLGATIALFCDIVVASSKAKIADPHVLMGLSAGDGGSVIWPALIGYSRAKTLLLTGDAVTGEEAERIGLIHRAVPLEELDAVTDALAQRIANGASRAVQFTKRSINIGLRDLAEKALDRSFEWECESQQSADHREAVRAFIERRTPVFSGD